jgi:isopentenyl-diphosphate delta-isomerase type 1
MKDIQNEQFIVVNEKDEVIGYKTRYECHHNKNYIHRAVDIILTNNEGKIVMQKRSLQKDLYPGCYCVTASGHVSKGESYEDTAQRELKEEMGVDNVQLQKKETFITYAEKETEMITIFVGTYNGVYHFPKDEVESVHFFSKGEMKKISPITPSSIESLKRLKWL